MSEDDFSPASECDEVLDSLVSAVTTPPAQRKPLTEEEIEEIAARTLFPINFARAIEAKLKENT